MVQSCSGAVVPSKVVESRTVTSISGTPARETSVPELKFAPVTVTLVPPELSPACRLDGRQRGRLARDHQPSSERRGRVRSLGEDRSHSRGRCSIHRSREPGRVASAEDRGRQADRWTWDLKRHSVNDAVATHIERHARSLPNTLPQAGAG